MQAVLWKERAPWWAQTTPAEALSTDDLLTVLMDRGLTLASMEKLVQMGNVIECETVNRMANAFAYQD